MARLVKLIQYALWILIWVLTPHLVWIAIALLIGISIWRWGAPLAWRLIGALMGLRDPRKWLSKKFRENRHMRGSTYDELRFWAWDWIVFALRNGSVLLLAVAMALLVGADYVKLLIEMPGKALEALNDPNVPTTLRIFGLAGLIGAPFLIIRAIIAERQAATAADAREDQRLVKAIEQLGAEKTVKVSTDTIDTETTVERKASGRKGATTVKKFRAPTGEVTKPNIEMRLGAVALLEQISRDSARDHWGVMEAFCAYLRNNGPEKEIPPCPVGEGKAAIKKWREDLPGLDSVPREILLRISRRPKRRILRDEREYENPWPSFGPQQPLPLDGADLRGARAVGYDLRWANLEGAHLDGANLEGARLGGAYLYEAHLKGANLFKAHLQRTNLSWARLEWGDLPSARLERANLSWARLERADLSSARLDGANLTATRFEAVDFSEACFEGSDLSWTSLERANLSNAYLERAKNLTQTQIESAFGDGRTTLPPGLTRPAHWPERADRNKWEDWKESWGFS